MNTYTEMTNDQIATRLMQHFRNPITDHVDRRTLKSEFAKRFPKMMDKNASKIPSQKDTTKP